LPKAKYLKIFCVTFYIFIRRIEITNLKNIALDMNFALDRDKELLDKINTKSEIVTKNMKKNK